jgi:hypothetical protein
MDMELIMGPLHGRSHNFSAHYISFDERYLKKRLELARFRNVRKWNPKDVLPKDYDDISMGYVPHMNSNGICISLNVECEK